MINIRTRSEYEGRFKLRIWDRNMQLKRETDWMPNLITNMGLDTLGMYTFLISNPGFYRGDLVPQRCWIGSGNTPPANTDTTMTSVLAPTAGVPVFGTPTRFVQTVLPYYASKTFTYRFDPTGSSRTIAEIGTFLRTSSSGSQPPGILPSTDYMFNHALVVDGLGVPTTIVLLGDETLDVIYELRVYPLQADTNYNVTITGSGLHACTMRACHLSTTAQANNVGNAIGGQNFASGGSGGNDAYSGTVALGPITGVPTGTVNNPGPSGTNEQLLAYTPGTFQRTIVTTWNLTAGSATFLAFTFLSGTGNVQVLFSPGIPKTNAKILSINNQLTWARRSPL